MEALKYANVIMGAVVLVYYIIRITDTTYQSDPNVQFFIAMMYISLLFSVFLASLTFLKGRMATLVHQKFIYFIVGGAALITILNIAAEWHYISILNDQIDFVDNLGLSCDECKK